MDRPTYDQYIQVEINKAYVTTLISLSSSDISDNKYNRAKRTKISNRIMLNDLIYVAN